jgi:hypothetical protein
LAVLSLGSADAAETNAAVSATTPMSAAIDMPILRFVG